MEPAIAGALCMQLGMADNRSTCIALQTHIRPYSGGGSAEDWHAASLQASRYNNTVTIYGVSSYHSDPNL